MPEKKLIAGSAEVISLREAFIELYKLSGYADPDSTDLRILFSPRSKYANCEFILERDIIMMGSIKVRREGTIKWLHDGEPLDNSPATEWLTKVIGLLEWLLWEGHPLSIRRVGVRGTDRIVPHHHTDRETFVRVNLHVAFEDLFIKEPPVRSAAVIKGEQGETFRYRGMYLSRSIFNALIKQFTGSSKKRGAPTKDRNRAIQDAVLAHGKPEDFISNDRFLFFIERHGITAWVIKDGKKVPFREGWDGPVCFGDETKPLERSTITNMRLQMKKLI